MSGYQAKVYRKPGGDELVVATGGKIRIESGGALIGPNPRGEIDYYVDSSVSASGDGLSWATALKTITEAVALMVAGDRCFIQGSFNEAVEVTVAGVELIGVGATSNKALWTAPDTTAPCLKVTAAADVGVYNIRFRPAVANAAIELSGASHQFQLVDCRIQGKANSYYGLLTDGAQANVHIRGCEFFYLNTATYGCAILGQTYASSEPTGWMIEDCFFHSNLRHVYCRMRQSVIRNNVFSGKGLLAAGTMGLSTVNLNISGATGGCNVVVGNLFGGDYSTTGSPSIFAAGTDDNWVGNISDDISETEVEADGTTVAVPAA